MQRDFAKDFGENGEERGHRELEWMDAKMAEKLTLEMYTVALMYCKHQS